MTFAVHKLASNPIVKNAGLLYILQLAALIFPMITFPYLARILRPDGLGILVLVQTLGVWGSLIIEYGFTLSATRKIAQHRNDSKRVAEVAGEVWGGQSILAIGAILLLLFIWNSVPILHAHYNLCIWGIVYTVTIGFRPLWYYQGIERLTTVVIWDFIIRASVTILTILLIKHSSDLWRVLALQSIGATLLTLVLAIDIIRNIPVKVPSFSGSIVALREGWSLFIFRSVTSLYTSANTFLLGVFAVPVTVGYYGGAEKVQRTLQNLLNPLAQALYPRMSYLSAHDPCNAYQLMRRSLIVMGGFGLILGGVLAFTARWLLPLILGPGYEQSVLVAQILAIVLPFVAVSNVLGVQWMVTQHMDAAFTRIIIIAAALNLLLVVLLVPRFGAVGMASIVSAVEVFVTISMACYVYYTAKRVTSKGR